MIACTIISFIAPTVIKSIPKMCRKQLHQEKNMELAELAKHFFFVVSHDTELIKTVENNEKCFFENYEAVYLSYLQTPLSTNLSATVAATQKNKKNGYLFVTCSVTLDDSFKQQTYTQDLCLPTQNL